MRPMDNSEDVEATYNLKNNLIRDITKRSSLRNTGAQLMSGSQSKLNPGDGFDIIRHGPSLKEKSLTDSTQGGLDSYYYSPTKKFSSGTKNGESGTAIETAANVLKKAQGPFSPFEQFLSNLIQQSDGDGRSQDSFMLMLKETKSFNE